MTESDASPLWGSRPADLKESALEALLMREHAAEWTDYLASGEVASMEEILAAEEEDDASPPGPFDSLLFDDPAEVMGFAPEVGEEDDPDEDYDPLPGFKEMGSLLQTGSFGSALSRARQLPLKSCQRLSAGASFADGSMAG